jgi:anti-sigma regulatory factor (Ser/Thr protein kinase)
MGARSSSIDLPSTLSSVPIGRHFVRDLLVDWDCAAAVDDASLAVTELIANAVKHARTRVLVKVTVDSDIVISVRDSAPQVIRAQAPAGPLAESGRGLRIVAAISTDWGITTDRRGKCLWFSLPLPDEGSSDADVIAIRRGHPATPEASSMEPADLDDVGGTGAGGRSAG